MMNLYPYGANILVWSTSNNFNENFNYRGDFITSKTKAVKIEYKYTEYNGTLVGISTNLDYTWNKNNKTFTLSNSTLFNNNSNEKPYINLLCNNVEIYPFFEWFMSENHPGHYELSRFYSTTTYDGKLEVRGWSGVYEEKYENNPNRKRVYPHVIIATSSYISWSTGSEQTIFFEDFLPKRVNRPNFLRCDVYYNYLDDENKIQFGRTTLWNGDGINPKGKLTIPKLNGTRSSLKYITEDDGNPDITVTKKFINYFAIGHQIRIRDGFSIETYATVPYVIGNNQNFYERRGFIKKFTDNEKHYLLTTNGIPSATTGLEIEWNNDYFYMTEDTYNYNDGTTTVLLPYYISPSNSIIYSEEIANTCYNDFTCTECEDYCPNHYSQICGWDCGCDSMYECENQSCPSQVCENQCGTQTGTSWRGVIKFDNTFIVNWMGNWVRYADAGEEVTVIGESHLAGHTGPLYYQIGSDEYTNHHNVERI